ncbi:MAG: Lrp/AsnC family transcriptional regulator [Chromatiales bacterium]|nr:Lrp/AsnC family transcriptional regulator [Chromatiales bacterium]
MWFVIAAPTPEGVDSALREIGEATGLQVFNFPKQHEFYLGLWLALDEQGVVDTVPVPLAYQPQHAPQALDAVDYRIIGATQAGLPIVEEPLVELGGQLGLAPAEVADRMQSMLDSGAIRRIGAVPNHYRLGLRGNGMTVWDVPDDIAIELGEQVGALDFVSHSYLRPRYPGVWPYNLFAMVHGRGRDEVSAKAERVAAILGPHCRAHDVLFSSEVLKKTGLRLAA